MPGFNHLWLIEPLFPAVLLFVGDAPRSRATRCWRPVLRGSSLRLSPSLGHDLEPKIFWGHITVPGVPEPVPGSGTLIPMGGWYGSPYRTHETTGAHHPQRALYCPESPDRPELTNSPKGEVSGVDKGPSNGWHLFRPHLSGLSGPALFLPPICHLASLVRGARSAVLAFCRPSIFSKVCSFWVEPCFRRQD